MIEINKIFTVPDLISWGSKNFKNACRFALRPSSYFCVLTGLIGFIKTSTARFIFVEEHSIGQKLSIFPLFLWQPKMPEKNFWNLFQIFKLTFDNKHTFHLFNEKLERRFHLLRAGYGTENQYCSFWHQPPDVPTYQPLGKLLNIQTQNSP